MVLFSKFQVPMKVITENITPVKIVSARGREWIFFWSVSIGLISFNLFIKLPLFSP